MDEAQLVKQGQPLIICSKSKEILLQVSFRAQMQLPRNCFHSLDSIENHWTIRALKYSSQMIASQTAAVPEFAAQKGQHPWHRVWNTDERKKQRGATSQNQGFDSWQMLDYCYHDLKAGTGNLLCSSKSKATFKKNHHRPVCISLEDITNHCLIIAFICWLLFQGKIC